MGCSSNNEKDEDKLSIVTTIFPQYDFIREITKGVDNVEVKMLFLYLLFLIYLI